MKNKKKNFILFAAVDIGYRIEHYTKFIDNYFSDKLKAESFSKYVLPESHYKTKYTYTCSIDKTPTLFLYIYSFFFFLYSLYRFDIFHFFSGETILTRKLRRFELKIYKLLGKRVVMHFVGSDIRSEEYLSNKEKNIHQFLKGEDFGEKSMPYQKKLIADAETYADFVIVSTPDLKKIIPNSVYYPVVLDYQKFLDEISSIPIKQKNNNEVVILHSPSSVKKSNLKGTSHITTVLNKIASSNKYNVRLVLPAENNVDRKTNYSASRYELFSYYKEADIVVDQMIIGWYGLLSVEALVAGKHVVSYVDESLKKELFPECPIRIADVNTLEEVLNYCIEEILKGKNSMVCDIQRNWVKKYHTIENMNEVLLSAWNLKSF
jgi:hypothetical protein